MKLDLSLYLQTNQSPPLGPLPPGSRLPLPPNPHFTGRREEMLAVAQHLFAPRPASEHEDPVGLVLSGPPASGKTQLAAEFAYRYGRGLSGVHWLDARMSPLSEIAACGIEMDIRPWPGFLKAQVHATRKAWADGGEVLVVLDHLEDLLDLPNWTRLLPGNARLLVTCREAPEDLPLGFELLPLMPLRRQDSLSLLRQLIPAAQHVPLADLQVLAGRLQDAPLSLELAGRYLAAHPGATLPEYLHQFDSGERSAAGILPTLSALFAGLPEDAESAANMRRLLGLCAWCSPDLPIPLDRLAGGTDFSASLGRCYRLGLLRQTPRGPVIYAAQALAAQTIDQAAGLAGLKALVPLLARQAPRVNHQDFLLAHLWAAARYGEERALPEAGLLWNELGLLEKQRGEAQAARQCFTIALGLMEPHLGGNHPAVLRVVTNLGVLLHEMGDLAQARLTLERSAGQGEGSAHALAELGAVLHDLGELRPAREALERAVELEQAVSGPSGPLLAGRLFSLGLVLSDLSDHQAAREAFRRALEIDQAAYGAQDIRVGRDLTLLASAQQALGAPHAALITLQRARPVLEKKLPPAHPLRAALQIQLAALYADLNELPRAEGILQEVLTALQDVSGPGQPPQESDGAAAFPASPAVSGLLRPDASVALSNLGAVRAKMGKIHQAQQDLAQALSIDEQIYHPEHFRVAADLAALAQALLAGGDFATAVPFFDRAVKICQKQLGPAHPTTLENRLNLAGALRQSGKPQQALDLLSATVLESGGETPADPLFLAGLDYQMALAHIDLAQWTEARSGLQRVLKCYESSLPFSDPRTARALHALALTLHAQGDLHGARACCRKALDRLPSPAAQERSLRRALLELDSRLKNPSKP